MNDLVAPGARAPHVGLWDHALADPNLEDARFEHGLSALSQVPGLRGLEKAYRRNLRLKSWQYMTAANRDWLIGFVVGTAGFASNGFVYVCERASGKIYKRFAMTPGGRGTEIAPSSAAGTHRFTAGELAIEIANRDGGHRFEVRIDARTEGDDMPLRARLTFASAATDQHLAVCTPLGERWNYTHKFDTFAVTGELELGSRKLDLGGALGTLDFTKSYALRHSVWKWIALAGHTADGRAIGINLVDFAAGATTLGAAVARSGAPDRAAPPKGGAQISENCAWVAGARIPLADVSIAMATAGDPASTWTARAGQRALPASTSTGAATTAATDGRTASLDLRATPIAHVEQRLDVPLLKHRLLHVVVEFTGTLHTPDGAAHQLDRVLGIAEDNDTWW